MTPIKKDCVYYVRGKCARNDEGVPMCKCKGVCEFFLNWHTMARNDYPDNTYDSFKGLNGMTEKDY